MQDRTDHNRLAAQMNQRISVDPAYVDTRLREVADFEARANGDKPQRRSSPSRQVGKETAKPAPVEPSIIAVSEPHAVSGSIAVPPAAPTSLLDIILVAGSDRNFDVEKFRALVQIQREDQDRSDARADRAAELAAEAAFDVALSEVQGKIKAVIANQYNGQTRSNYADYDAFDQMVRPVYVPAGFSLSFDEDDSPKPDHIRVVCWVTHVALGAKRSHKRKYHADIPADGKGARGGDVMTKTHAAGSAFTYGKRYVVGNIFNIAIRKDDDGNAASARPAATAAPASDTKAPGTISLDQARQIRDLLDRSGIKDRAFLISIRLNRIEDIGVEHFDKAVARIKSMGRRS